MFNDDMVADNFANIFDKYGEFGKQVYLIGLDKITSKIKNNLVNKYLKYEDEYPLLAFDYFENQLEYGLVITTQRIVWSNKYDNVDSHDVPLEDIEHIDFEKSFLIKYMRVIDVIGNKSEKLPLSPAMDNPEKFVHYLNQFIKNINNASYNENDDDDTDLSDENDDDDTNSSDETNNYNNESYNDNNYSEKSFEKSLKNFVRSLSKSYRFDSDVYFSYNGSKSESKINSAIAYYADIDSDEYPIFCYDSTMSGDASDGVLGSTKGIYIHNYQEEPHFISYDDFDESDIEYSTGFFSKKIKISGETIDTAGMSTDHLKMLCAVILECQHMFSR